MKLSKSQKFFIDTIVEALDYQYKDIIKEIRKLLKDEKANNDEINYLAGFIMLEYEVKEEKLNLNAKDIKKLKGEIKSKIKALSDEEFLNERGFFMSELEAKAKDIYEYKSFLMNVGMSFDVEALPNKVVKEIIMNKVNGLDWSERLWKNKQDINSRLIKEFGLLLDGKTDINSIKDRLNKIYKANEYNIDRLVRNELARVQSEVNEVFDKENGIEYQMFMATIDNKTTKEICAPKDGKVYRVDNVSKPIPPLHINCRSCLVSIPSKDFKLRTRRNNETKEIIEYKTYQEWIKEKQK